jgi:hypothetical protein
VVVVLTMIFFFPVGIALMWLYAPWRTRTKWIWSGVFAVLVALVVIGSVFGGDGDKKKNASSVDAQASPTLTDAERQYSQAAATALAAAPAEPTVAPPAQSLTEQCIDFTSGMSAPLSAAVDSMTAISTLATNAGSNPSLVFDASWKADVRTAYQGLQKAHDDVASLSAPTQGLEEIRSVVLQGFEELLSSEAPFLQGAAELDAAQIGQATDLISTGTETFTRGTALVTSYDVSECVG